MKSPCFLAMLILFKWGHPSFEDWDIFLKIKLNWRNECKRNMINESLKGKKMENCMIETKASPLVSCLISYQLDNTVLYRKL